MVKKSSTHRYKETEQSTQEMNKQELKQIQIGAEQRERIPKNQKTKLKDQTKKQKV